MAYFSESAKARILAAEPEAAKWINSAPRRNNPARSGAPKARTTSNRYPGSCQRCHGHVAAGQGILDKISGNFVIYHADGTCPDKQHNAPAPKTTGRRNKYAGSCSECGGWVEAEQGLLTGSKGAWKTRHDGECPTAPAEDSQGPQDTPQRPAETNLYGGRCTDCGAWVEAKEGRRIRIEGRWTTCHLEGQCPETETTAPDGTGERIELTAAQIEALPLGYYTVELENGDYRTFRLRLKPKGQRNEGKIEISYLGGPNNMSSYWLLGLVEDNAIITNKKVRSQVMRDTLAILIGDPHAAQMGFARRSSHCYKCGQPLTTPESLDLGIGPDCANKN